MTDDKIQAVFDHWNLIEGLRHVQVMEYHHRHIIGDWLKHYSVERVCQGIDNYAKVLLGKEYYWTKSWKLWELLGQSQPKNRNLPQFLRFLLDFNDWDFLLPAEKAKRKKKQPEVSPSARLLYEAAELKQVPAKPNTNALRNEAVRKLRNG